MPKEWAKRHLDVVGNDLHFKIQKQLFQRVHNMFMHVIMEIQEAWPYVVGLLFLELALVVLFLS